MKKFKLGINHDCRFNVPFEDRIKIFRSTGFDAVFTNWSDSTPVEQWAEIIAKEGLIYQSIHAPFLGVQGIGNLAVMWEDPGDAGEAYTDLLIRCVKSANYVGVPLVIIHPYIGFERHDPSELGLSRFARVIEVAEKHGVRLGFENVEGIEYMDAIWERFSHIDSVGFCWDTGHEVCYNGSHDMMAKYGDKLYGTHFNDNFGKPDPHLLPFDGDIDWSGVMGRIKRHGYRDILTFEVARGKSRVVTYDGWTMEQYCAELYSKAQRLMELYPDD